jgi:hypothetical protein
MFKLDSEQAHSEDDAVGFIGRSVKGQSGKKFWETAQIVDLNSFKTYNLTILYDYR